MSHPIIAGLGTGGRCQKISGEHRMGVKSTQVHGLIGLLQQVIDFCESDADYVDEDLNHWAEAAGFCYAAQDELHYVLRDLDE